MGSSKKQTIGYRYFMGLHFGLCQGPVDALMEIRGGDRTAWRGDGYVVGTDSFGNEVATPVAGGVGEVSTSQRIYINAPKLWGGEKKEGGVEGALDVMMGEPTQEANDYLQAHIAGPMPAFRGMLSLVFRGGMVGAMNPYPKPWKFQVRRILAGWQGGAAWYPEKAEVQLFESNEHTWTVPYSAQWKYRVEEPDSEADYSAADYDDSGWSTGPGGFGSGYDTVGTTVPAGVPGRAIWLRRTLPMPAGAATTLTIAADDGYWVWWNGELKGSGAGAGIISLSGADVLATNVLAMQVKDTIPTGSPVAIYAGVDVSWSWSTPGAIAMNPAHIAYQALTDPDWGLGYPEAMLDLDSFAAAADTFYAEGLGLCLQWVRQDTIEGFIQDVMNHAGAVLAQDPRTALFRVLPIRGGYTVADLPEFRRGLNVVAVESFERAAITETTNEITVVYTDVATGKKGSVTIQHLANIQAQGGVASQTVRYPGAPTQAIAQRLALRDLTAKAQALCKVRLTCDRSAYGILPGQVVRWTDSKLGIVDMPMRVLQVAYGNLTEGRITMDLAEDVFGLPATTYLGQQSGGWEEPNTGAAPSPQVTALEAPYVALVPTLGASALAALDATAGFVGMAAASPGGTPASFALYTRVGAAAYGDVGSGTWSPGGLLAVEVDPLDTELMLADAFGYSQLSVGMLAMLGTGADAELVRIDGGNAAAGTMLVARGCGDTVAKPWPLGTRLWVLEDAMASDPTEYAAGETVDAKAATEGSDGDLPVADAPGASVTLDQRQARPYPPGLFRINGNAYPEEAFGELTVTWAHRDRLLQADQLYPEGEASIGPEPGTTYTLRTYVDGVLLDTQTGVAGTSATVSPAVDGTARVELESERDGLTSWQMHAHEFTYFTTPPSDYVDQAGSLYADQDGNTYAG